MANILVCDDDKDIVEAIEIYLTQEGYHILKAYDGQEALDILNSETVDLLIIDVMMPRLDGIRATVKIRESNPLPIIILSAKSEDTDKILGLNIGADDYITKPFNPLELIARVKSQLRRYTQLGSAAPAASEHIYTTGGLTVNDDKKEVLVDGEAVRMTPIEYNILLLLMKNPGRVFSYDGQEALDILNSETVDLLIIDVMMPRLDGIRATVKIRESNPLPIIILSAKSEDTDKILGLNIGADDYITKPFNPLELIARVKSQLRRYTQLGSAAPAASEHIYTTGGLTVNDDKKEVLVDGEAVRMTPIEYNILLLLMKNPGRVFSTTQIYESIWNEDALAADNTVAVHVRHIREKIEINPRDPRYLKVVWGLGYKIEKLSR